MYRRIRKLRENKGMSQADMARLLNCTQVSYSRYEGGKRKMPSGVLLMLADFYGVSTDYLLERTDQKEPYPE